MAVNANDVESYEMNSMIGTYAKEDVSVVEKRRLSNTIGMDVYVLSVVRHEMSNTIGMDANAHNVEEHGTKHIHLNLYKKNVNKSAQFVKKYRIRSINGQEKYVANVVFKNLKLN